MGPAIWIVVSAAFLSGFFALNSFALRSLSRSKLEDALSGPKGRRKIDALDAHLDALELTMSLCKALSNLVVVVGMIKLVVPIGEQPGELWVDIILAIVYAGAIIAVIGVGIPHAWACYAGEKVLAKTLPLLLLIRYLFFPVTAIMASFDLPIRRLSGTSDEDDETAEEDAKQEILQAAADGAAEGAVDADEVEMIESVMEFGDTDAAEIMTPRTDIFALPADASWEQAANEIQKAGHTRVPVYEDNIDNIKGFLYAKDLLKYVGKTAPKSLESICRKPFFVPETKPLDDLLKEFKTRKVHIAVVLDEYGGTAGLVTIEDVIEEIVGDISDEYDQAEEKPYRRINETTVEVEGRLRVDELNDLLELELPEDEDYDTVAGFAIAELGYIPTAKETFSTDEADFTILQADERKISRLRVHKKLPEEQEE